MVVPYFAGGTQFLTYFLILCASACLVCAFIAGALFRPGDWRFAEQLMWLAQNTGKMHWASFRDSHRRHLQGEVEARLAGERAQLEAAVDQAFDATPGELRFVQDEAEAERESLRSPTNL